MTQDQVIVLMLKIFLITGFFSLTGWVALYTYYQPWWKDPIGRTLVIKTALIAGLFVPSVLSLFFQFNRLTSHIAAWIDVVFIGAVTPVMLWRIVVWRTIHRDGESGGNDP